jgi:hypothetical protein
MNPERLPGQAGPCDTWGYGEKIMRKTVLAVALIALTGLSAQAAPVTDWRQIDATLAAIPTGAGVSLKQRLANCKISVQHKTAWMETRNVAWPQYGAKPGQTVLQILMDMPPEPKQPGPAAFIPNPPRQNVPGIWVIDHGKPTPVSAWANALQNRPIPLGYDASKNC